MPRNLRLRAQVHRSGSTVVSSGKDYPGRERKDRQQGIWKDSCHRKAEAADTPDEARQGCCSGDPRQQEPTQARLEGYQVINIPQKASFAREMG